MLRRFIAMTLLASAPATAGGAEKPRAPVVRPAPYAADIEITTAFLIGRWTDTDDCTVALEFRSDGTFEVPGGSSGLWVLNGDELILQGTRTVSVRVSAPDANTVMVVNEDGTVGRSTRCPQGGVSI